MRLRQVALVSSRLDGVVAEFAAVFGLKVAYEDPGVGKYGLRNAVLPAGTGFLEVVEPVSADASARRFLERRGGDAGYMVILQVADAPAEERRALAQGARVVERIDRPDYYAVHFHPRDFGGLLVSFDQQRTAADPLEPFGDWMPAGPDWRGARTDVVVDLAAVTIRADDPAASARLWSQRLGRAPDPADPLRLPLARGEVRFAPCVPGAPVGVAGLDLAVADVDAVRHRARDSGLDENADGIAIGGMRLRPVPAR